MPVCSHAKTGNGTVGLIAKSEFISKKELKKHNHSAKMIAKAQSLKKGGRTGVEVHEKKNLKSAIRTGK